MTTATASPKLAPTPAVKRGFRLNCIRCGERASLALDLDDCDTFRCPECEADFGAAEVREMIAEWQRALAWIDQAPPRIED